MMVRGFRNFELRTLNSELRVALDARHSAISPRTIMNNACNNAGLYDCSLVRTQKIGTGLMARLTVAENNNGIIIDSDGTCFITAKQLQ